jgi:hypothetical protein
MTTPPELQVSFGLHPLIIAAPHAVRVEDRGAYTVACCSCGWHSAARRSRPLARQEALDHEALYAVI